MTRSELATWIVRVCELYPDRVTPGPTVLGSQKCVMQEIGSRVNALGMTFDSGCHMLSNRTVYLSDSLIPWGQIPVLLGLVPGEMPADVTEPEVAVVVS